MPVLRTGFFLRHLLKKNSTLLVWINNISITMEPKKKVLVTGAGGFIGHHLVRFLKEKGYWVRGVDIKYPEYSSKNEADDFMLLDLRNLENCLKATEGIDEVYALAADMGGMGFIMFHTSDVLYNNVAINSNTAEAARQNHVKKVFFASSACAYPKEKQEDPKVTALKESDAYPANPDSEYGWEKLFSERLYKSYNQFYKVRIARFHNIFGLEGTYKGERAKAPAELCRKVAEAKDGGIIEVWSDGKQTRSFCYIDDCVEGVYRLMQSDFEDPLNIGSDRLIAINDMVDMICGISGKYNLTAGKLRQALASVNENQKMNQEDILSLVSANSKKKLEKKHLLDKPQGVRGRNSDNTLCKQVLKWEPKISLEEGLEKTYQWIEGQLKAKEAIGRSQTGEAEPSAKKPEHLIARAQ
jgi:GDP-D-mannose 3',5'-epimerase